MNIDTSALRGILSSSRLSAVKNFLAEQPAPFKKGDFAKIENHILAYAPEGSDVVELLEQVRKIAVACGTPEKDLKELRVAVEYPLPRNPFADGLEDSEQIFREASEWIEEAQKGIAPEGRPALKFFLFVISAIVEFRILHVDYIPAILRSLHEKRHFLVHPTIWAVPLSLSYGSQENAERRLLILRQRSTKYFAQFLRTQGADAFIGSLSKLIARKQELVVAIRQEVERESIATGAPIFADIPSIVEVIKASLTMALLKLPSIVVAARSRQIVSHGLPPEILGRIGGWHLPPFPMPKSSWLHADRKEDDPDTKLDEDSGDEPKWMRMLRAALDVNGVDHDVVGKLASESEINGSILAEFTRYLDKTLKGVHPWHGKGNCKPVSARRYCLLIATKVIPRLGDCPITEVTDDAWEDGLEQILDEDAFYQLQKYASHPKSNAQSHSRPLVKAIRHWLFFLHEYLREVREDAKDQSEQRSSDDLAKIQALMKLEQRLPPLGLVKVDASFITVEEYHVVLDRLVGVDGVLEEDDREAAYVATVLAYRGGLRRQEVAGLRCCDFDKIRYLHVRPTMMRPLKTSNASRDLPLPLLIPDEELHRVLGRVAEIRRRAEEVGLPPDKAYLFSRDGAPDKQMFFDGVVQNIDRAFRGDMLRNWSPIDPDFRFHRLRHSFANLMLLKLWPELRKFAWHVLKNCEETLRWIEGWKEFREGLFETPMVIESDLQAIALLLGHGSAATSLEHYISVLDWYEIPQTWTEQEEADGD
jgi:integrase